MEEVMLPTGGELKNLACQLLCSIISVFPILHIISSYFHITVALTPKNKSSIPMAKGAHQYRSNARPSIIIHFMYSEKWLWWPSVKAQSVYSLDTADSQLINKQTKHQSTITFLETSCLHALECEQCPDHEYIRFNSNFLEVGITFLVIFLF